VQQETGNENGTQRDKGYVQGGILEYTVLLNTRPYTPFTLTI